ncbi:hypothetical protein L7F22_016074 [Adiantum nelumboides]|nr:hypothetical protein [Adiantum nelumboides]
MVIPQEWRLRIGTKKHPHNPCAFPPSDEDVRGANALLCSCGDRRGRQLLKRDCQRCSSKCSTCKQRRSLASKEVIDGWDPEEKAYIFSCTRCTGDIFQAPIFHQGDPRNFSLQMHWDGFQAATTTLKSSAVVEIIVLNGGKQSNVGFIPVLFLPLSHKELERKHGDILSCFLEPLILELESMYVAGFEVDYAYPKNKIHEGLSSEKGRLYAMLMMCTGDHPAQCKLGQVKDGGKNFCRHCKADVSLHRDASGSRYVYGNNRLQARYTPERRHVEDMWKAIRNAKRCSTKDAKEKILGDAGLSGQSILWRLYHLYGFDISKDLVYDTMHILSLNLFQKYLRRMILNATPRMKKDIDSAVVAVSKSIPRYIINSGRWPNVPSQHFKMFKAEECQKFVQWCVPHILKVRARKRGWTSKDIQTCRSLLTSWRILSEEYEGPNSSPLEHVAGSGEIFDDILRHGSHDCFWCFVFERCVSGYLGIPTNNKANEISYTNFHSRMLFTKLWRQLDKEKDGLFCIDRSLIHAKGVVVGRKWRKMPFLLSAIEIAAIKEAFVGNEDYSRKISSYAYDYSKNQEESGQGIVSCVENIVENGADVEMQDASAQDTFFDTHLNSNGMPLEYLALFDV